MILNNPVVQSQLNSVAETILQWEGVQRVRFISAYGLDNSLLDVDVLVSSSKYLILHKPLFDLLIATDKELEGKTFRMWYLSGFITQHDRPILPEEQVILEVNK
jgi:hypothetical protein